MPGYNYNSKKGKKSNGDKRNAESYIGGLPFAVEELMQLMIGDLANAFSSGIEILIPGKNQITVNASGTEYKGATASLCIINNNTGVCFLMENNYPLIVPTFFDLSFFDSWRLQQLLEELSYIDDKTVESALAVIKGTDSPKQLKRLSLKVVDKDVLEIINSIIPDSLVEIALKLFHRQLVPLYQILEAESKKLLTLTDDQRSTFPDMTARSIFYFKVCQPAVKKFSELWLEGVTPEISRYFEDQFMTAYDFGYLWGGAEHLQVVSALIFTHATANMNEYEKQLYAFRAAMTAEMLYPSEGKAFEIFMAYYAWKTLLNKDDPE